MTMSLKKTKQLFWKMIIIKPVWCIVYFYITDSTKKIMDYTVLLYIVYMFLYI